ncbi:amino acid aminotransferase (plasmid) [Rhizobium leguminosarum]|uniref:amino acid aminotransferase n=1 Tax=Rhizobium TaxID=379 RepID=UPI001031B329|nr:amino acid aminotransferase [Rhizobium leguminosarum]MDH6662591.1 aspartate/tyrosine/aromatic aminotransferase [Rhizobium sophorae]MBB4525519.1 aromatic-amino-acid transaminase [Rhizobium leguminosarum]MBY5496613.1 aspartate/tyrosine/aromatic aminotransferase [Rhizobium leguminosarum]NKJ94470.1 aminotransferase class I/II-fold pyridoxal phosphate-dependent enzyme [Rhizobium leguminosarum bv. viciae]NKK90424.1 aminotransferase class I/II-fold pyridoxal phosphate-dependent enzyme [Rhizobium l
MFETLTAAPPDKILSLSVLYRNDARPTKMDLGVGVYKDSQGATVIMRAVRDAEKRLYESQTSKTYVGMAGDEGFNKAMLKLVFGEKADLSRMFACQTAGGSGALRTIADLLAKARADATVWLSDPTWVNHVPILKAAGLNIATYPYFDPASGTVKAEAMLKGLKQAKAGDIILVHGCCHNPTGANLTIEQWGLVADLLVEGDLFPFIDLAYQGFGDGLEADAAAVRLLASKVPEMAVATSCSKNFSVYRDRVGAVILMGRDAESVKIAGSQALATTRVLYSMPPDHAAAAVRLILEDDALRADWKSELEAMRLRMLNLRKGFAEALRRQSNTSRFDFIADHRGMFSRLGLTEAQVDRLRDEFGIYMVGDSRFNVAGLREDRLDDLAKAVVSVL